jgi:hypothetical protein
VKVGDSIKVEGADVPGDGSPIKVIDLIVVPGN